MLRIRARRTPMLDEWWARYLVKRYLPTLKHLRRESSAHIYASERAWHILDIDAIAAAAEQVLQHITGSLGDIISSPMHIYLLEPEQLRGAKRFVLGFRRGVVADSSGIVYATTPQHFHLTITREVARTALAPAFGAYFLFWAGFAEYLVRLEDNTFYYDVGALADDLPLYSLEDVLDGFAPLSLSASFAHFLTEQFGREIWKRLHADIYLMQKRVYPLFAFLPKMDWLLTRATGFSLRELEKQWQDFLHLRCEALDRKLRQAWSDRLAIRRQYEDGSLRECADACLRYLSFYGSDLEVVFYGAVSYMRLKDYLSAAQVLSSHAEVLPQWHRAWAYLRLGQVYDLLGDRGAALRSYNIAQDLSDVWGVIGSKAEQYILQPFHVAHTRTRLDEWLHFQCRQLREQYSDVPWMWLPRSEPHTVFTVYYSVQV